MYLRVNELDMNPINLSIFYFYVIGGHLKFEEIIYLNNMTGFMCVKGTQNYVPEQKISGRVVRVLVRVAIILYFIRPVTAFNLISIRAF